MYDARTESRPVTVVMFEFMDEGEKPRLLWNLLLQRYGAVPVIAHIQGFDFSGQWPMVDANLFLLVNPAHFAKPEGSSIDAALGRWRQDGKQIPPRRLR